MIYNVKDKIIEIELVSVSFDNNVRKQRYKEKITGTLLELAIRHSDKTKESRKVILLLHITETANKALIDVSKRFWIDLDKLAGNSQQNVFDTYCINEIKVRKRKWKGYSLSFYQSSYISQQNAVDKLIQLVEHGVNLPNDGGCAIFPEPYKEDIEFKLLPEEINLMSFIIEGRETNIINGTDNTH